jgi:hypothetical protein
MSTSLRLVVFLSLLAFVRPQRCRVVPARLLGCSRWSRADLLRCDECGLRPVPCQGRRNFYRCQPRPVVTTAQATTTTPRTASSTTSSAIQTAPTSTTTTTTSTTQAAPTPTATTASTETQTTTTSTSTTTTTTPSQTQLGEHSCPDRGPLPSPCPFARGNFFSNAAYCATSVVSESGCRAETDGNNVDVAGVRCPCSWGVSCRCGTGLVSNYVTVVSTRADCSGLNGDVGVFRDCILTDGSFCKPGPGGAIIDNNLLDSRVDICCTAAGGNLSTLDGKKRCLF